MSPRPTTSYLVCATPRSGSTLLCEMLLATGCAGRPLEHFEFLRHSSLPRQPREYFTDLDAPHVHDLLAPLDPGRPSGETAQAWWERILREGSTENGVWGGKIMWGHVEDFVSRARELPGLAGADLGSVLDALLAGCELVFVTRPDKAAQAVSLWRAVQTQAWRHDGDVVGEAIYDYAGIDHLFRQLQTHEAAWARWFEAAGVQPLEITYDEIDAAPQASVARVLERLGLPDVDVPDPHLSRQRDQTSLNWIERYERERQASAVA